MSDEPGWSRNVAKKILDMVEPDAMSVSTRALLAGIISATLDKVRGDALEQGRMEGRNHGR